jgi:glycerol-3-phosphate dehydrogenase
LQEFDLLVIGGGINGAGVARDAAGRGLSVLLAEKSDLAGATSSWSSKLIHGGLRYLEHYEFRLVAEALAEREVLLRIAAHLVWPARFVMPHVPELRPRWMIRTGLFLYDNLGRRTTLPGSQSVRLHAPPYASGLRPGLRHGFLYSDCRVDDARLVVVNAMDARARRPGAHAHRVHGGAARSGPLARAALGWRRGARARRGERGGSVGEGRAERQPGATLRGQRAAREGKPHRAAAPVRGRARLHPAERRPARGVHDPL